MRSVTYPRAFVLFLMFALIETSSFVCRKAYSQTQIPVGKQQTTTGAKTLQTKKMKGAKRERAITALNHEIAQLATVRTSLEKILDDYGGHKNQAIQQIDSAMQELRQAVRYGIEHPHK